MNILIMISKQLVYQGGMTMNEDDPIKLNMDLLGKTVNECMDVINKIVIAEYSNSPPLEYTHFIRNVCLNLMGNYIYDITDHTSSNAFVKNIECVTEELKAWAQHLIKLKKQKETLQ